MVMHRRTTRGLFFAALIVIIAGLPIAGQYIDVILGPEEETPVQTPAATPIPVVTPVPAASQTSRPAVATPNVIAAPKATATPIPAATPVPAASQTPKPAVATPNIIAAPNETQRPARDVTTSGMTRVYMPTPAESTRKPATVIHIKQAGVTPNGTIAGTGGSVRLYGVVLPEASKICESASGESWPCGRRAYIALHNKVAAQTLACEPKTTAEPIMADCRVGKTNLSVWFLSQGLGRLAPNITDKEMIAAEAAARKANLGIWRDPRELSASASARNAKP
jgi:endonuclease YncB( thermonuclease family)